MWKVCGRFRGKGRSNNCNASGDLSEGEVFVVGYIRTRDREDVWALQEASSGVRRANRSSR